MWEITDYWWRISGDKIGKLCWFWIDVQGAEMRVLQSLQDEIIQNSVFVLEVWEYGLEQWEIDRGNRIDLKNHYAFNLNLIIPNIIWCYRCQRYK